MIEHLRKYTGMIIFVIALLFVGLAFFGDQASFGSASPTNPVVLTVDGTGYTHSNFRKMTEAPAVVAYTREYQMAALQLGLWSFVGELSGSGIDPEQTQRRFFINRLNIQEAAKEFGIHPSEKEVDERVKRAFSDATGSFRQDTYDSLLKNLHPYGMQEKDLIELVRDVLTFEKLKEVLAGGLAGSRQQVEESIAASHQQVTIQLARTALSTFQEQIKPTDEELNTAWTTLKDRYKVERKIKVTYLLAKPQYPERKTEPPKLPTAVTEEQKKAEEKAEQEKKAKEDEEYASAKKKVDNEVYEKVSTVLAAIENSEAGVDFEKAVAEQGLQLVTTDFFQRSAMPPELSMSTVESRPKPVGDYLLHLVESKAGSLAHFTEALQLEGNAYLIARLDASEPERVKTFEEAKEEVRTDYIKEKANEALKKDADDKAAKIREGLKAGKSFADVAKEVGLEPKSHGPFKENDKLEGEADVSTLFQTAATVDPGTLADPVVKPDGAIFIFVEKRELVKDPTRENVVNQTVQGKASELKQLAFQAWLDERLAATRVETPKR